MRNEKNGKSNKENGTTESNTTFKNDLFWRKVSIFMALLDFMDYYSSNFRK